MLLTKASSCPSSGWAAPLKAQTLRERGERAWVESGRAAAGMFEHVSQLPNAAVYLAVPPHRNPQPRG